jgi:hypothetical protein
MLRTLTGLNLTASLQLPEILYAKVVAIAESQSLALEEFMILAVAEKVAAMEHHEWLNGKAGTGPVNPCDSD